MLGPGRVFAILRAVRNDHLSVEETGPVCRHVVAGRCRSTRVESTSIPTQRSPHNPWALSVSPPLGSTTPASPTPEQTQRTAASSWSASTGPRCGSKSRWSRRGRQERHHRGASGGLGHMPLVGSVTCWMWAHLRSSLCPPRACDATRVRQVFNVKRFVKCWHARGNPARHRWFAPVVFGRVSCVLCTIGAPAHRSDLSSSVSARSFFGGWVGAATRAIKAGANFPPSR